MDVSIRHILVDQNDEVIRTMKLSGGTTAFLKDCESNPGVICMLSQYTGCRIEKICNLTIEAEGYCSEQITDSFSFYETPEGVVIPKSMIRGHEFIIEVVEGEEAEEIEKFAEPQKKY